MWNLRHDKKIVEPSNQNDWLAIQVKVWNSFMENMKMIAYAFIKLSFEYCLDDQIKCSEAN